MEDRSATDIIGNELSKYAKQTISKTDSVGQSNKSLLNQSDSAGAQTTVPTTSVIGNKTKVLTQSDVK